MKDAIHERSACLINPDSGVRVIRSDLSLQTEKPFGFGRQQPTHAPWQVAHSVVRYSWRKVQVHKLHHVGNPLSCCCLARCKVSAVPGSVHGGLGHSIVAG